MFKPSIRTCVALATFCCCIAVAISQQPQRWNSMQGSRLANGRQLGRGKAGFMAQIRNKREILGDKQGNFICAGTIISERHIVTAAHCLSSLEPDMLKVVVGQVELDPVLPENKSLKTRGVQEIFVHPDYVPATFQADVAVLKVKSKIGFGPKTWKVDLCADPVHVNDELTVYGWGQASSEGQLQYSNKLKEIVVPVLAKEQCSEVGGITDPMMCAGLRDGQDVCPGDSGGPAIYGDRMCGIVSWGDACGSEKYPGIYTNVTAVRQFLDDCLKK